MNIFDIFESKRPVKQLPANFKPKNISPVLNGPYGKENATQGYLVGESEITEAYSRNDAVNALGALRGKGKKIETGRETYDGNLANEYVTDVWDVYTWLQNSLDYKSFNDPKLQQVLEPVMKLRGAAKKLETKPGSGSNARFGNLIVNTLYPLLVYIRDVMEVNEGYRELPSFDRDKYQERSGLEGPFPTQSGKVVYYDPVEGSYYDPDTDMYISYSDFQALDEGLGGRLGKYALAALLGLGTIKGLDSTSAQNTPLGQALSHAADNWSGEEAADALELYRNMDALVDQNSSDLRYWASQNQDLVQQFKESVEVMESDIDTIRRIVADRQAEKIHGVLVDMFTASAIAQVYDAVNDKNKSALDNMLKSQKGLMKIADFATKQISEAAGMGAPDYNPAAGRYKSNMEYGMSSPEGDEEVEEIVVAACQLVEQGKLDVMAAVDAAMQMLTMLADDTPHKEAEDIDVRNRVTREIQSRCDSMETVNEKFDMAPTPKSKQGMYKGRTADQLRKQYNAIKKKENKSKAEIEKMRELAFAVRAKTGWGKVNESEVVEAKGKVTCGCDSSCKHCGGKHTAAEIGKTCKCCNNKIRELTVEDVLGDLQKKLGDYLQDVATAVKKDSDLLDKSDSPSAELAAPVKTITTDDGHEIKIHGNEDDGFRITINNRSMKSQFKKLDDAEMATEMYCNRRRNESRDYISEV